MDNKLKTDDKIAWAVIDIETTGLDAELDVPIEVGIKLIEVSGLVVAEAEWLVWEDSSDYEIGFERGKSNKFVQPMHQKSGLWHDLTVSHSNELYTREEFDIAICEWLDDMGCPLMIGMMGNSTGSLDRPFTLRHFPKLNERLGYRNIDMSTLKELVRKLNPTLWENIKPIVANKDLAEHRVMSDIDACIAEYRCYAMEFLMVGNEIDI